MSLSKLESGFEAAYGQIPQAWQNPARALVVTLNLLPLFDSELEVISRSSFSSWCAVVDGATSAGGDGIWSRRDTC